MLLQISSVNIRLESSDQKIIYLWQSDHNSHNLETYVIANLEYVQKNILYEYFIITLSLKNLN